jgi:hypothetical protein
MQTLANIAIPADQVKYLMTSQRAETCCIKRRMHSASIFLIVMTEQNKEISHTRYGAKI